MNLSSKLKHGVAMETSPNNRQYDPYSLPDFDTDFISSNELEAFAEALTGILKQVCTLLHIG